MKRKELKNFVKKIIQAEAIIRENEDKESVRKAKEEIINISNKLSVDDMLLLDELIQELIQDS